MTYTLAPSASAAGSTSWGWQQAQNIQQPVEQQSPNFFFCGGALGPVNCAFDPSTWVSNPTGCVWDMDDYIDVSGNGDLPKGQTMSTTTCAVADGFDNYGNDNHPVEVLVTAPTNALTVTLVNDFGVSFTATPVYSRAARAWQFQICTRDTTPGPFPVIDGSNGGTGTIVNWPRSVTNDSNQTLRRARAVFDIGGYGLYDTGCP